MRVKVVMDVEGECCDSIEDIRVLLEEDWGLATAQKVLSIEEVVD